MHFKDNMGAQIGRSGDEAGTADGNITLVTICGTKAIRGQYEKFSAQPRKKRNNLMEFFFVIALRLNHAYQASTSKVRSSLIYRRKTETKTEVTEVPKVKARISFAFQSFKQMPS